MDEQPKLCQNCGSEAKPAQFAGQQYCVDCVMDVAMDAMAARYRSAASNVKVQEPSIARKSRPLPDSQNLKLCANPHNLRQRKSQRCDLDFLAVKGSCSQDRRAPLATIARLPSQRRFAPLDHQLREGGTNAVCQLCGRIWYGQRREQCKRCKGLCVQRSDHDLGLMGRHPQAMIEGN